MFDRTPPRLAYVNGQVSFWRPGAEDWAPAQVNTPLAPGDLLYAAPGANLEVQAGARAFLRASGGTQLGLDALEPDYLQFRVAAGTLALDIRELRPGHTIEVGTPHASLTVERPGFYRVDAGQDATSVVARRGGRATLTVPGAGPVPIEAGNQLVVRNGDSPRVESHPAPEIGEWDRWNYARTDALLGAESARYVPPGVYGVEELDRHGTWRVEAEYGPVWAPRAVPVGWAPYTSGRWIWDPHFGWTWLDEAPWGWAPYHYGRWVHVRGHWGWAPGPVVVRPIYAPALVAFFGFGHGRVVVGGPVSWVALGWGEPLVPWWGRPGFVGRPWWGGWGGPRVVNNRVVHRTTVVNVTNITVYRNVTVKDAVVAVPAERFGHGPVRPHRVERVDRKQLTPIRGAPDVRPVPASLVPATGPTVTPPEDLQRRKVVTTRPAPGRVRPGDEPGKAGNQGANVPGSPAAAPERVDGRGPEPRRRGERQDQDDNAREPVKRPETAVTPPPGRGPEREMAPRPQAPPLPAPEPGREKVMEPRVVPGPVGPGPRPERAEPVRPRNEPPDRVVAPAPPAPVRQAPPPVAEPAPPPRRERVDRPQERGPRRPEVAPPRAVEPRQQPEAPPAARRKPEREPRNEPEGRQGPGRGAEDNRPGKFMMPRGQGEQGPGR